MRLCNKCSKEKNCDSCNNQVNENKEYEANLKSLTRPASCEIGHMLPYFKE